MVAEMLGLPQANVVTKLEIEGRVGHRPPRDRRAAEKVVFSLPAVVSAQKGLNEPRYETLKGIMAAKKKAIPVVTLEELGLTEDDVAPQVEISGIEMPPARQAGKIIPGTPEEAARALARLSAAKPRSSEGEEAHDPRIHRNARRQDQEKLAGALGEAKRRATSWDRRRRGARRGRRRLPRSGGLFPTERPRSFCSRMPSSPIIRPRATPSPWPISSEETSPRRVFFAATAMGKDLAPRLAARLGVAMASDCTKLAVKDGGSNSPGRSTPARPFSIGGSRSTPQIATLRPNVFSAGAPARSARAARSSSRRGLPDGRSRAGVEPIDSRARARRSTSPRPTSSSPAAGA